MSIFSEEQIAALNNWARTAPTLNNEFLYTNLENVDGLGDLLAKLEYIVVRQATGIASFSQINRISFNDPSFYVTQGTDPNEAIVNFRGSAGGGGGGDHGSLSGLGDDDHTQYFLIDGSRNVTGNLTIEGGTLELASTGSNLSFEVGDNWRHLFVDANGTYSIVDKAGSPVVFNRIVIAPGEDGLNDKTLAQLTLSENGNVFIKPDPSEGLVPIAGAALHVGGNILAEDRIIGEAFYLPGAGNIYNDDGNTIIETNGGYTRATDNLIAGDPGSEGDSISIGGTSFTSQFKASDLNNDNPVDIHIHKHASVAAVLMASRSRAVGSTHVDVEDGDSLFNIYATGWQGSTYEIAGALQWAVDGNPGTGFVPGRLNIRLNDRSDTGIIAPIVASFRSGGHLRLENTLDVENAATAEAFYIPSGGSFFSDSSGRPVLEGDDNNLVIRTGPTTSPASEAQSITFESPILFTHPTQDANFPDAVAGAPFITVKGTVDVTGNASPGVVGFEFSPIIREDTRVTFGTANTFLADADVQEEGSGTAHSGFLITGFQSQNRFTIGDDAAVRDLSGLSYIAGYTADGPYVVRASGISSGTVTVNSVYGFQTNPDLGGLRAFNPQIGAGATVEEYVHYQAGSGGSHFRVNGTLTTEYGIRLENISRGSTNISLWSDGSDATMRHLGGVSLGKTTAPNTRLDVAGSGTFSGRVRAVANEAWSITSFTLSADADNRAHSRPILRVTASGADRTITGFVAGEEGDHLRVIAIGSNNVILADQDTNSSAANRIITHTGADVTLTPPESATLIYDTTSNRWRIVNTTGT